MKLLKFWMDGCGPCVALKKSLETVDHPLVKQREDINVNESPEMAIKYGLRSVPVMIIEDVDGTILKRHNGFMSPQDIKDFLTV